MKVLSNSKKLDVFTLSVPCLISPALSLSDDVVSRSVRVSGGFDGVRYRQQ